ncbi:MAG: hypothetical protein TREMPRED_004739 [Tremellales sp. Tagirdzhanova-0007]|nr:MAG: hypothetical protein TREMPRED_004739 [Tremellales sp. Tagirdzhanova-0007]
MARPMQDCIVLFGDSLTQRTDSPGNLSQLMAESYQRKLDILNRGFGGYNTVWQVDPRSEPPKRRSRTSPFIRLLEYSSISPSSGTCLAKPLFDEIFARKGDADKSPVVRLVTIWFGTNDSVLPSREQHVSLPLFISNLSHFLDCLTSPNSPYAVADTPISIILITPPPCLHSQMEVEKRPHRSLERTREFRDAVVQLGKQWDDRSNGKSWAVKTVDLWKAMVTEVGEGEELAPFFFDGVHLTTRGYGVLWKEVTRVIKVDFKGRGLDWEDFDDLPRRVPIFSEIDYKRPESVVQKMALPTIRKNTSLRI